MVTNNNNIICRIFNRRKRKCKNSKHTKCKQQKNRLGNKKSKHEQPDLGSKNIKMLKENNGIAIGNKESKKIYLTFDEGYEAGYTTQILQTLKEENVKATFFITAHYVNTQPELVGKMIEEGHIIRKPHCKT